MQKRIIFGLIALAIFMPLLFLGGITFQLFVGFLSMLAVSELLRMKRLEVFSFEGVLAMLGAFVLTVPIGNYLNFLPLDANFSAFSIVVFLLLAGIVFNYPDYTFDDVVFPIASSLYVGIGFQNLVIAQQSGFNKVMLALLIIWATDSGAYLIGVRYGRRKLPTPVSPSKTIEGSLGGVFFALVIASLFMFFDTSVYAPYSFPVMMLLVALFSIAGQFGDLIESAIKRYFGVKDSGKFIPGHGGVLDRFDSMLIVLPLMHFVGLF
ncbi:phosphatidate cytidylyltransferase [Streptococcus sp. CSL10205-OR2]|uniref:phosphatidate cytidylyltransferase n=1 Tax=Streptococcus sp. CSL10205-OR2 TaxID=2980558 RepID=UPI0021D9822A|nr:phosphatidate cytidylyltransferase [Streptococcus sp. CSL10205-OR2]MCU9533943.1 phosphatidate cytidylyltransferase [Streptococcus sp. CSL10205-OR2]